MGLACLKKGVPLTIEFLSNLPSKRFDHRICVLDAIEALGDVEIDNVDI
jgi:hypothetical protein